MNAVNRVSKSILRNPIKSLILLVLVTILCSVIAGSVLVRQATDSTIVNLRRSMPPLVSIEADFEEITTRYYSVIEDGPFAGDSVLDFEWVETDLFHVSHEQLIELGNLPYVAILDLPMGAWVVNTNLKSGTHEVGNYGMSGTSGQFFAAGVLDPDIIYFTEEVLTLVAGRSFIENDLQTNEDIQPILISSQTSEQNNLFVGDLMTLYATVPGKIPSDHGTYIVDQQSYTEEFAYAQMPQMFEIIGIFDRGDAEVIHNVHMELDLMMYFNDRVFVSHHIAYEMNDFVMTHRLNQSIEHWQDYGFSEEEITDFLSGDNFEFLPPTNLFVLYDVEYIEAFTLAAEEILPPLVHIRVASSSFYAIESSMDILNELVDLVLWVAIGVTVLIIGLLLALYLYDRRKELGIYLALGEKRSSIVWQILMEVLVVSVVGITLALFIGNQLASVFSLELLEREVPRVHEEDRRDREVVWDSGSIERRGFSRRMQPEEMLEAFSVSIDTESTFLFYSAGIGTIAIASTLPVMYILKLKPKKILEE